jgi:hypothetical protein
MAIKVFTLDNLKYYHGKIKALLAGKVDKVEGKGLSTNDFTDAEKAKLGAIAEGAQVNVIESVQVDGVAQAIAGKQVTLDLSAYAKKSDITNAVDFRGIVATASDLPSEGMENGDVYHVTERSAEYIYIDGKGWEELGSILDLSAYSTTEQMNSAIQQAIADLAVAENFYTKTEMDAQVDALEEAIGKKVDQTAYDTKVGEINNAIGLKADKTYVDSEIEAVEGAIADVDAKFAGYYTKAQVDSAIDADVKVVNDRLTTEVATLNGAIADVDAKFADVYTKTEVDGIVDGLEGSISAVDAKFADYTKTADFVAFTEAEIDTAMA